MLSYPLVGGLLVVNVLGVGARHGGQVEKSDKAGHSVYDSRDIIAHGYRGRLDVNKSFNETR